MRLGTFWDLIHKSGNWLELDLGRTQVKQQGEARMAAYLRKNPNILRDLITEIREYEAEWLTQGKL